MRSVLFPSGASLQHCRLRMFKLTLLILTVSGLQAAPLPEPEGLQRTSSIYQLPDGFRQGTEPSYVSQPLPDDFRQGTEPSRRFLVDLNTGLVHETISEMERRAGPILGNGFGEMQRRHWLIEEIPDDVPVQRSAGGWVRVEEALIPDLPDGFRQGTEPKMPIPDGFRQGTEPKMPIPDGFRQGTEPKLSIPDGFRQGTEPMMPIPDGFRQGTEPKWSIPDGFRQGTEPKWSIPDGFRQGTEPKWSIPDGFRQGTEPVKSISGVSRQGSEPIRSIPYGFRQGTEPKWLIPDGFKQGTEPVMPIPAGFRQGTEPVRTVPEGFRQGTEPTDVQKQMVACKGEVIDGKCYEFNPTPMTFENAQFSCSELAPNAMLASITSSDLHSRLVSLVTKGGENHPVLTWLGGTVGNQQGSWVDGSEWSYSNWMPGHPNIHSDKPVCLEMFKLGESWWTAADCELERASICSYSVTA